METDTVRQSVTVSLFVTTVVIEILMILWAYYSNQVALLPYTISCTVYGGLACISTGILAFKHELYNEGENDGRWRKIILFETLLAMAICNILALALQPIKDLPELVRDFIYGHAFVALIYSIAAIMSVFSPESQIGKLFYYNNGLGGTGGSAKV